MGDRDAARIQEARAFGLGDEATWENIYKEARAHSGLYVKTRRNAKFSVVGCLVLLVSVNLLLAVFLPIVPVVMTGLLAIYCMTGVVPEPRVATIYAAIAGCGLYSLHNELAPLYYLLSLAPAVTACFIYALILALALPMRSQEVYFLEKASPEIQEIHQQRISKRRSNH